VLHRQRRSISAPQAEKGAPSSQEDDASANESPYSEGIAQLKDLHPGFHAKAVWLRKSLSTKSKRRACGQDLQLLTIQMRTMSFSGD
jgi:hypothetical protein